MLPSPDHKKIASNRIPIPLRNRGQVAIEFMLYTTVFMFVAVAAFIVVNSTQSSEIPLQQNVLAKETGSGFVNVISLAVKAGPGFSYNYTFPKSLYNIPYKISFTRLSDGNFFVLDWPGSYGDFSYSYGVPLYNYQFSGSCLNGEVLISSECSNVLMLNNDGEKLTITQLP